MSDAGNHNDVTQEQLDLMDSEVKAGFRDVRTVIVDVREALEARFDKRLDNVDKRLDKVAKRLGGVDRRLTLQTRRLSALDRTMRNGFSDVKEQLGRLDQRLTAFFETQARMAKQAVRAGRRAGSTRQRRRRS